MATSNIQLSSSWTKVAESTNDELLITWGDKVNIEFATTSADAAPTVRGHVITFDQAITRSVIGSGFVWAKTVSGAYPSTITLVVSK